MICAVFIHETMHRLRHHFLPLETTPPGLLDDKGSESGWALEARLLGGIVSVTWPSHSVGDYKKVTMLTVRPPVGLLKKISTRNRFISAAVLML